MYDYERIVNTFTSPKFFYGTYVTQDEYRETLRDENGVPIKNAQGHVQSIIKYKKKKHYCQQKTKKEVMESLEAAYQLQLKVHHTHKYEPFEKCVHEVYHKRNVYGLKLIMLPLD